MSLGSHLPNCLYSLTTHVSCSILNVRTYIKRNGIRLIFHFPASLEACHFLFFLFFFFPFSFSIFLPFWFLHFFTIKHLWTPWKFRRKRLNAEPGNFSSRCVPQCSWGVESEVLVMDHADPSWLSRRRAWSLAF